MGREYLTPPRIRLWKIQSWSVEARWSERVRKSLVIPFSPLFFFNFYSVFYIVQNNRLAPTAPPPPGNHEYATEYLVKVSKEKEQCYVC